MRGKPAGRGFNILFLGEESPKSGPPINHRRRFIGVSGRRGFNTSLLENRVFSILFEKRDWGVYRKERRGGEIFVRKKCDFGAITFALVRADVLI